MLYFYFLSEYFYEVYMTEFPVTRYYNLRFKLDYHSNVFVKVGVHERAKVNISVEISKIFIIQNANGTVC